MKAYSDWSLDRLETISPRFCARSEILSPSIELRALFLDLAGQALSKKRAISIE
jgi:hypothetical protein